jgi:PIN domain nuclease of toxin-antitoxin system
MRYLLDTHTLLWLRANDPRLSRRKWSARLLDQPDQVGVSIAALWEMTIKRSLGKLKFDGSISEFTRTMRDRLGFRILHVDPSHLERLESLEFHHRDPFDRLMIAQALEENATCVTRDRVWARYPVRVDW